MNIAEEIELLRSENRRLSVAVEDLKKDISHYKSETEKLEWEKTVLNQDVHRMSTLFKTWINEIDRDPQQISSRSEKINMMVKYPCRSISEILQLNGDSVFMTSCQSPYFIEFANSRWSYECGWNPSEVLGLTCSFLQGEMTDRNITKAFMRDIRSSGYGQMRIINYRKSGQVFEVDVAVFPIFDSICALGPDAEVAVLTHFATVLSNMQECKSTRISNHQESSSSSDENPTGNRNIRDNNSLNGSSSGSQTPSISSKSSISQSSQNNSTECYQVNLLELSRHESLSTEFQKCSSGEEIDNNCNSIGTIGNAINSNNSEVNIGTDSDPISTLSTTSIPVKSSSSCRGIDSNPPSNVTENGFSESCDSLSDGSLPCSVQNKIFIDRRNLETRFVPKCGILSENFYQFGNTLRLSNLLRLMLSSQDAMGLLDSSGRFIHVNVAWSTFTGYELNELEGHTLALLEGPETDVNAVKLYRRAMEEHRTVEVKLVQYHRSKEKLFTQMTVVPIQGGYLQPNVSHYGVLCREIEGLTAFNTNSYNKSESAAHLNSHRHNAEWSTNNNVMSTSSPNFSTVKRSFHDHANSSNDNFYCANKSDDSANEESHKAKKNRK